MIIFRLIRRHYWYIRVCNIYVVCGRVKVNVKNLEHCKKTVFDQRKIVIVRGYFFFSTVKKSYPYRVLYGIIRHVGDRPHLYMYNTRNYNYMSGNHFIVSYTVSTVLDYFL